MPQQTKLKRPPRREDPFRVPRPKPDGLVEVDATWGEVQPIELAPGVRTIGERELIEHLDRDRPLIDTRPEESHRKATIPGARGIPHAEIVERIGELDPSTPTVFFCNGPQCTATPQAVEALLGAGYPSQSILYYRGGMHDWMTLGYPTERGGH